jgi:hypothetical protein
VAIKVLLVRATFSQEPIFEDRWHSVKAAHSGRDREGPDGPDPLSIRSK